MSGAPTLRMEHGVSSDQNARFRRTMEDQHIAVIDGEGFANQGFFAVIDGHGGRQAADYVEGALFELFRETLKQRESGTTVAEVFDKTFVDMDEMLKKNAITLPGCTIATSYIEYNSADSSYTLHTANLGDARAVLSRSGHATRLTFDHKATDPQEQARIISVGGFIMRERVNGTLAITRALGDIPLKPFVLPRPYTTETRLKPTDNLLLLACDGVWDVMSDQDAIDFVLPIGNPQEAADKLLQHALQRGSMDNITVMVIHLHWH